MDKKQYIVINTYYGPSQYFIVYANSKKESIEMVCNTFLWQNEDIKRSNKECGYSCHRPILKKDFNAIKVGELKKREGDIINISWL